MSVWAYVKTMFILQMLLGYVFVVSGLIINILMLVTCICVWPWNKQLYRKIVTNLAYMHWCELIWMVEWWAGSEVTAYTYNLDDMPVIGQEHHIVISNHKHDVDWLALWTLAERKEMLQGTKLLSKSSVKWIPIIGWAWYFTETVFINRNWKTDKSLISSGMSYLDDCPPGYWTNLLVFPEGTRFTPDKHKQSMEVAREKGLPELKHHLLPRTKGFVEIMRSAKGKVHSIMDMTVGICENSESPSFLSVLKGTPVRSEIFCRRIPLDEVPMETDEACAAWLHKLFQEKDEIYDNFVQNNHFTIGKAVTLKRRTYDLVVSLLWIVTLTSPLCYYFTSVLISSNFAAKVALLLTILVAAFGVRKMIATTESSDHVSSYGLSNKSHDNGAKKQL